MGATQPTVLSVRSLLAATRRQFYTRTQISVVHYLETGGGKFKNTCGRHGLGMAEWKDLCLHEDVERLILARLESCELSARMLAGVQNELVSRKEAGAGRVGEVALEFVKKSGMDSTDRELAHTHTRTSSHTHTLTHTHTHTHTH